jgi:hypothetical protein
MGAAARAFVCLALIAAGCGGLERHAELLAAGPEQARVLAALRTLAALDDSGALALLRSGECGPEPPAYCPGEVDRRPDRPNSACLHCENACTARCLGPWRELERVQETRAALAAASHDPRILEPFARVVRDLSPGRTPRCTAPASAPVQAQRAVLRHLFELDPVQRQTLFVRGADPDLGCLRIPTLAGTVPVGRAQHAPVRDDYIGPAIHFIGEAREIRGGVGGWAGPLPNRRIVELQLWCGPECGGAEAYAVELRDGEWRVVDTWTAGGS